MYRVLPLVVVIVSSCSRSSPAKEATGAAAQPQAQITGAGQASSQAPAEVPKPMPAQLPEILARVNGETVTKTELESAIRNVEAQAGGQIPPEQRDSVLRGLLNQLVGLKLLGQEAKARNVVIPDPEVDARLGEIQKQFPSADAFEQTLRQRRLTIEELRADARQDLAVSKLIENAIADKIGVTPEQVTDFHQKNPDRFKQPDRVRASHILIAFPQSAEAPAKAQARAKAEQVLKDVKAGKDFAALAKQHSTDPGSAAKGGDLGYFQQGQMVGPFNDVAFTLAPGATSDLVETQFGYHIIRVIEKQRARAVPLDEVRAEVVQFLQDQNRQQQTEAFVNTLKSKGKVEILI